MNGENSPSFWCQPKVILGVELVRHGSLKDSILFENRRHSLLAFRKHQGWWQALESKLRGELTSRGLEKMLWAHARKER